MIEKRSRGKNIKIASPNNFDNDNIEDVIGKWPYLVNPITVRTGRYNLNLDGSGAIFIRKNFHEVCGVARRLNGKNGDAY